MSLGENLLLVINKILLKIDISFQGIPDVLFLTMQSHNCS